VRLSSDYNKLAWGIRRKYGIPLKWAMKSAYTLRELGSPEPMLWLSKPIGPLSRVWDPANVMKLVAVLRSQSRLAEDTTRELDLNNAATSLYDRYCSLEGVGCELVAKLLDGELVYWATKYYVDSLIAKKRRGSEESSTVAINFSEGNSYTTFWFDYFDS
jgi:hypothetical protein